MMSYKIKTFFRISWPGASSELPATEMLLYLDSHPSMKVKCWAPKTHPPERAHLGHVRHCLAVLVIVSEQSQTQWPHSVSFHFYEMFGIGKFLETVSVFVVARGGAWGRGCPRPGRS